MNNPSINQDTKAFAKVAKVIAKHGPALAALAGVVEVWAGYKFRDGKLTKEPAVLVSVLAKVAKGKLKKGALLPEAIEGVAVDVVAASPAQLVRFAVAHGAALTAKSAPSLLGMVRAAAAVAAPAAPRIPYVPAKPPLKVVEERMTMVCHASPDAGWRVLSEFFGKTKNRLVATMYEFTGEHILTKLGQSLAAPHKLELIMDDGNVENEGARAALKGALGTRMKFVWAAVADGAHVKQSFFPTAYHIKVAVRDGRAVWLSSGNWKESNQPERDPIVEPFATKAKRDAFHRKQNRDWHVVVESLALAGQFERFIRHDMAQAKPLQKAAGVAVARAGVMQAFFAPAALVDAGGVEFFGEQVFDKKLRVMPLLTPDNYVDHVLPLIKGAKRRIYFQNQSLSAAVAKSPRYGELVKALCDKSKLPGSKMDIRILVRGDFDPHKILSALAAFGFNMERVRLQKGNHNKGILIDDQVTVIGSHNWTGQGTTENRDASLIVEDAEVTGYFTKLFLHDWERRSSAEVPAEPVLAAVAAPRAATPKGMVRMTAREIMDGCPPDVF